MNQLKTIILGILAGISIGIGGLVFLASDSRVIGALFFTIGLFVVCTHGFSLYTGKVCYALDQKLSYIGTLFLIWVGNFTGCFLTGYLMRLTRLAPNLIDKATDICNAKLSGSLLSTFILGIFCNICIYIAVEGYKNNPHEIGKYVALFLGVFVFIIAGFEHCIANMFYFSMAGIFHIDMLIFLIINTLGNAVGGLLFPALTKLIKSLKTS